MLFKIKKKQNVTINIYVLLFFVTVAFLMGIILGRVVTPTDADQDTGDSGAVDARVGEYKFISPLVGGEQPSQHLPTAELKPFRYKVKALVEKQIKEQEATDVAVYFRDLNNGNRFGVNENEKFSPASLLKIPLMIAYFKWTENDPLVLSRKLTYTGGEDLTKLQYIKPIKSLEPGKSYTVEDLIYRMVAYADDNAFALLSANIPARHLDKVYQDLYVDYDPTKVEDSMTINGYASFFRVLFNASYLSREMSEKALSYLSHVTFKEGMVASIPPDVDIASKFGERTIQTDDGTGPKDVKQLHEFGIVYYTNRPYLLGIMTRGDDFKKLEKVIRDISRLVYEEVDRQSMLQ